MRIIAIGVFFLTLNSVLEAQFCPAGSCDNYVSFIDLDNQSECTGAEPLEFIGNIDNGSDCEDSYGDNCYKWVFTKADTSSIVSFSANIGKGDGCNGEADNFYSLTGGECTEYGSTGSQNHFTFYFGSSNTITVWICDGASGEVGFCTVCIERSPLPVQYGNFEIAKEDEGVRLNWSTLSEINNEGFVVQKRYEDSGWKDVAFVDGSGNSNVKIDYSYLDQSFNRIGSVTYRLKQVDYDGNLSYSDERGITIKTGSLELRDAIKNGKYYNILGQPIVEKKGLVLIQYKGNTYKLFIEE